MIWNDVGFECPKQTRTERGIVHPRLHTFNGDGSCDNNNHTLCMPLKCTMLVLLEISMLSITCNKLLVTCITIIGNYFNFSIAYHMYHIKN